MEHHHHSKHKAIVQAKMISNAVERRLNQEAAKVGLTAAQTMILSYLVEHDHQKKPLFQKDVELHFGISHPTVTGLIRRMAEKGFVVSETDEMDRRCKRIVPTQKSYDIAQASQDCLDEMEEKLLQGFTEAEKETLYSLLAKMLSNVPYSRHMPPKREP